MPWFLAIGFGVVKGVVVISILVVPSLLRRNQLSGGILLHGQPFR